MNAVVNQTPEVEFQNRLGALAHDARSAARYAYAGAAINAIASQRTEVVARLNRHAGFWNVVLGAAQTAAVVGLGRIYDTRKDVLSARRLLEHATRYTGIYRVAPVAALRPRSSREADWRPGLRLLAGQGLADGAVHAEQADTVRRIFQWFADGKSPRWIAGELNRLGVPSPGSAWRRTQRRRDGKWLVSAIHGVHAKGTGILNNEKYIGRICWGRLKLQRGAADSSRRIPARATTDMVVHSDERLRIVTQDLWERVKRRQLAVARTYAASQGRPRPKACRPAGHLLSGEIKCPECTGSFSVVSARMYGCTTHHNGGPAACRFDLKLSRRDTEEAVLELLQRELLGAEAVRVFMAAYQAELTRARRQSRRAAKPTRRSNALVPKYEAAIATLRGQLKAGALPEDVALDAIAATERRRQTAFDATEARAERQGADVVQLLPATAETLSRSLELAVRDRDFLRPDEMAEAKIGLRELLGGTPMRIERLADGRAALHVRLSPQALLVSASGGVDNVVAGARLWTYLLRLPR